jgi:hypothetical protein
MNDRNDLSDPNSSNDANNPNRVDNTDGANNANEANRANNKRNLANTNDPHAMNSLHNTNNSHDSVEARLVRAAQQLDTAAANYAYRTKTDVMTSAVPARSTMDDRVASPRRRFAPFAAIGGAIAFAGSLVFGASVISNQAEKAPTTVPVEVASPSTTMAPTSDFPFVGELSVSLPTPSLKDQPEVLLFHNGVAISAIDQRRLTLASAIDIDINDDGTKELAVLINHDPTAQAVAPTVPAVPAIPDLKANKAASLSKKSASKILTKSNPKGLDSASQLPSAVPTSTVAIVRVVGGVAKTLATTPAFDTRFDGLLLNRKTLWTMRVLDSATPGSNEAVLQRALINTATGMVSLAPSESPIARTTLPLLVDGDKQIRFSPGTKSALVFAAAGTRRGWFTAKAGQTLTIGTIGIPSSKNRQITILLRKGSNDQSAVGSGVLPGPFTTVLPHGGDYEILVGEGTAETTFELSIE